jgi:hypothetical protein
MAAKKVILDVEQRLAPDPEKKVGYIHLYVVVKAQNTVEWPIGHTFRKEQIEILIHDREELTVNIKA